MGSWGTLSHLIFSLTLFWYVFSLHNLRIQSKLQIWSKKALTLGACSWKFNFKSCVRYWWDKQFWENWVGYNFFVICTKNSCLYLSNHAFLRDFSAFFMIWYKRVLFVGAMKIFNNDFQHFEFTIFKLMSVLKFLPTFSKTN